MTTPTDGETPEAYADRAAALLDRIATLTEPTSEDDAVAPITSRFDDLDHKREQQGALYDSGFAGIDWPTEVGGWGLSRQHAEAYSTVAARYILPLKTFGVSIGLVAPLLIAMGSREQQQRHIRAILRAEEMWCQLFSEPGAGSDLAGLRASAVKVDGGWRVRGQKVWTTGAHVADHGLLIARTDPSVPKHAGLSAFILDMHQDGVESRPLRQMTGHAEFNEVFLEDAWVPDDAVIGTPGDGWRAVNVVLANERTNIGTGGKTRNVTTAPSALARLAGPRLETDSDLRQRIARVHTRQTAIEMFGRRLGEQPDLNPALASIGKLAAARQGKDTAELALDVIGTSSVAWPEEVAGVDRWAYALLTSPANAIAGGTDGIQRNVLSERVLGLPREPSNSKVPFDQIRSS